MSNFPTLGLKFDLAALTEGVRKLDSTKATFIKVGEEAEKSSKKVKKANRDVAESSDQVTEAEKKKTRATENAALAAQRSAREQERQLRMLRAVARALEQEQRLQIDLARAKQVSDNLAAIQNTKALSDAKTTADFRSRMNRQRQQEEEKTSQVVRSAMKSMSDAIVTAANIENRVREQTAKARVQVAQAAVQQMRQQRASVDSIAQERSATANLIVALRQLGEARAIAARQNAARVGADPVLAGRGARASVASSIGTARAGQASREAEAQRRLEQASNAVSASFLRQVATALGLGRVYDLLAGGAGRATGALGHLWSGVGRLRVGLLNARFAMALFLGALTVGPIVQMADGMTALEARTRLYAARASDVPYILEKTFLTAQKARAPLEGVAKLYTRLAPLADQLGRSQTDLLRVVETVSKAFSIGGASAAEATSSAQQFAQAISSNRFGGDELRSVAENAPVLLQVIAEGVNSLNPALNLNAATFIKWAQAGNATSEIMVKALERSATRIDEIFAQMPVTIGQSMTLLGNSMQIAIEQIDKLAGEGGKKLSEMIAEIIVAFGSFVSSDDTIAVVVAALRGLIQTFEALGTVISVVSNYFPVLVAALTSVLIARSLPLIFALVRTQLLGMAAASVVAGSRMAFLSAAMTATQGAAVRAGVAIKSAFAFVGGPLGLLLIAAAATFSYFSSTIVTAQEAVNKFDDATSGMYNAVERAATFMKTFGIESAETEKILMRLSGVEQDQIKNLDEAGKAALLRAERERALTVALLRRAAAESVLTGTELNKSAAGNERLAGMIRFSAGNEQGQPFDNARADAANRERTAAFQRSLAEKLITGAPALSELADKIAGADIVIPPIAEGSGIAKVGADADKAAKKVDGLRGALKRVADLQAQMIGLSREVGAALVGKTGPGGQDELEAFRAQLEALSNYGVAPAVRSDGSMETIPETLAKITNATLRKAAADEVALAAQVALKKIETERTVAIIEQSREVNNAAAAQLASTAAADDASAVMVDFYESSDRSARAYSSALKRQSDIQFEAALAAEALRVAWDNGYTSIEAMPPALREATDAYLDFYRGLKIAEQAEKEAAQKREADETHAKKIADLNDHTAALNKGRDALLEYERAQRAAEILARGGPMMTPGQADSYAAAEISAEARNREAQRLSDRREELSLVRSGVEQRKIEERVLAMSDEHLRQWPDAGRKFADYMARAKVSIEVLQERMAAVAGTINDEIRSAFVDERDIDFSKITDALGKAIRETLYDNLVSKPVKVIVDAAVNVATVGLQRMLETFMSSGSQGGGFDFGQFLGQLSGGAGFNSKRAQAGNVDTGWSIITGNGGAPNTDGQANAATAGAGGMLGQLGAFAGVPIIGWIGAAIAIVGQMDQLIEGRESSIRQKISWIGGNEDVAGKYPFLTPSTQMIISLFSKESNHGGRLDFADGFFTVGGDKATKERKEQLNSTGDFINGMLDSLASIGIDARGIITKLQAGDRDGSKLYTASGKIYSSKETTSDGLAQLIIEALMGEAQFENPHLKEIVTQMVEANRSWDQILDKMEKFLAAEQLGKDIKTDLLKFTDPKEAAMRQLREEQISRRRQVKDYAGQGLYTAEELSAILADLGQLEVKETQAALEDLADAGDLAASSLKSITDAQSAILSYVQSLRTGTLSPLSPTAKLGLTKGAFETMLTAAQGGDIEALQNITSSANEYLSAAQQYFGSGQGYTEIFDAVTTALDALGNQQFVDPLIETLEAEMAALRAAIAAAALDIITTLNGGTVITDAATVVTPADTPPITTDYGVTGNGGYTDYSDLANPMAPANDTDAILEALQSIGDQISDTLGNQTNALVASNDQGFAGLTGAVVDTTSIGVALAGGVVKKVAKP